MDDERDYYLPCGCWSGQPDHTCLERREIVTDHRPHTDHTGSPIWDEHNPDL